MDVELLKIAGQIAGVGGVALGVFFWLYRRIKLPAASQKHLTLYMWLVWSIAVIGMLCYVASLSLSNKASSETFTAQRVAEGLASPDSGVRSLALQQLTAHVDDLIRKGTDREWKQVSGILENAFRNAYRFRENINEYQRWTSMLSAITQKLPQSNFALNGVDLVDADLRNGRFEGTDFTSAKLDRCWFSESDIRSANFTFASLRAVRFWRTRSEGTTFWRADLREAEFNANRLWVPSLTKDSEEERPNLKGVDFRNANLEGANLQSAILSGANFLGANLSQADLRGADFTGAKYDSVYWAGALTDDAINLDRESARASALHAPPEPNTVILEATAAQVKPFTLTLKSAPHLANLNQIAVQTLGPQYGKRSVAILRLAWMGATKILLSLSPIERLPDQRLSLVVGQPWKIVPPSASELLKSMKDSEQDLAALNAVGHSLPAPLPDDKANDKYTQDTPEFSGPWQPLFERIESDYLPYEGTDTIWATLVWGFVDWRNELLKGSDSQRADVVAFGRNSISLIRQAQQEFESQTQQPLPLPTEYAILVPSRSFGELLGIATSSLEASFPNLKRSQTLKLLSLWGASTILNNYLNQQAANQAIVPDDSRRVNAVRRLALMLMDQCRGTLDHPNFETEWSVLFDLIRYVTDSKKNADMTDSKKNPAVLALFIGMETFFTTNKPPDPEPLKVWQHAMDLVKIVHSELNVP